MNKRQISAFDHSLSVQATTPPSPPTQAEPDPMAEFNSRLNRVRAKAAADMGTRNISARVPEFLARYVDQYAGRAGINKQEVLAEALALFAAHHSLPPLQEEDI